MDMDIGFLQAALVGYGVERQKIEDKMQELEAQLRKQTKTEHIGSFRKLRLVAPVKPLEVEAFVKTRPPLSAAAKKRIGKAQKARWKAYHANKKALEEARVSVSAARPVKKKRFAA